MNNQLELPDGNEPNWWAYLHINGGIHLKRYLSKDDLKAADESPFVAARTQPFYADNKGKANETALQTLMKKMGQKDLITISEDRIELLLADYEKLLIAKELMLQNAKRIGNDGWIKLRKEYAKKIIMIENK